jgi:hypothetical protein
MKNVLCNPMLGWVPHKLATINDAIACRWLYAGEHLFSEPFFSETIQKCQSLPENSSRYKCISDLDVLKEWATGMESIEPAAFIFHVSRCGSTLASQMLGLNSEHIVLSETPFLDEILRLKVKGIEQDEKNIATLFSAALRFYGAPRHQEKRLFIKTDSWHLLFYDQLRKLYPSVPFIILYRAPEEVLYSHQRRQGMQAVPGVLEPELFNFEGIDLIDLNDYMPRVLERYYEIIAAIAAKDNRVLCINYNEGIIAMMDKIAAFTGMRLEEAYKEKIMERGRYHAKEPEQVFEEKYATEPLAPFNIQQLQKLAISPGKRDKH